MLQRAFDAQLARDWTCPAANDRLILLPSRLAARGADHGSAETCGRQHRAPLPAVRYENSEWGERLDATCVRTKLGHAVLPWWRRIGMSRLFACRREEFEARLHLYLIGVTTEDGSVKLSDLLRRCRCGDYFPARSNTTSLLRNERTVEEEQRLLRHRRDEAHRRVLIR